ncbi:MAG: NAD(P)-dependent glycerol-3-phosphate dehydrogenase [Alphaproteobacteria bacterium]|nr:NAD(P)-dependent glycerol-3-phosphate dehydrogenase [Alphaproteobacteria bacterium]
MKTIGVIGGGAWGTALAQVLTAGGRDVLLQAREAEVVESINTKHENTVFLPGITLHKNLKATELLSEVAQRDILLMVTPSQFLRATLDEMKNDIREDQPVVICSKGIELTTGLLLSQVAEQTVPQATIAILTGPTFASEVARGLPTAVTIAAKTKEIARSLQAELGVKNFRPYVTSDIIGTQLGGAIKNVIAIACGIVHGKKLGDSARAALLTRGVAEIARLGVSMGADKETLLGMCGIGDLMLTCSSMQSRNFSLGNALGEGKTLDEILGPRKAVTEGVFTAESTLALAKNYAVDMPITEAVNKCLNEGVSIDDAIEEMLNRPFRYEMTKRKKKPH